MKTNENESIHSTKEVVEDPIMGSTIGHTVTKGLTKREYFASLAMQGMLANESYSSNERLTIPEASVIAADALINALNETSQL